MKSREKSAGAAIAIVMIAPILAALFAPFAIAGARIPVHPPRADVPAGTTLRFEAEAPLAGNTRWEVIPPRLGYVDGAGIFVAGKTPGKGIIRILWGDGNDRRIGHAVVIVGVNDAVPPVAILPAGAELRPGEEMTFALVGVDRTSGGAYRWAVDPPALGRVTDNGRFRAGLRPGEGRVFAFPAHDPGSRIAASIRIAPVDAGGTIADARIVPSVATVPVGEAVRFSIRGIPPDAGVLWSVVPSRIGVITPDGVFRSNPFLGLALDEVFRQEGTVAAMVQYGDHIQDYHARIVVGSSDLPAQIEIDPPAIRTVVSPFETFAPQPIRFRVLAGNTSATSELTAEWRVVPEGHFDVQPRFGPRTWLHWIGPENGNAPNQNIAVRVEARVTLQNGRVIAGASPVEIRVIEERLVLAVFPRTILTTVGRPVTVRALVTTESGIVVPTDAISFNANVIPSDLGEFDPGPGVFHPARAGTGHIVIRATSVRFPAIFAEAEAEVRVSEGRDGETQ